MRSARGTPTLRATLLVARKELVSSLRDRHTTLYAIVVPVVLYPFLFWALLQGSLVLQGAREHAPVDPASVAVRGAEAPDDVARARGTDADRPGRERVERRLAERAAAADDRRDPAAVQPLRVEEPVDVAAHRGRGAYLLSFLLPLLFVVMTVMGAFHPAVDLTAGERERRTADTTLLLPVPRAAVHQGKILAVCAIAVTATALNLGALGLSAGHLVALARVGGELDVEIPLRAFLAMTPLALFFALFVSAVLTGIAARTRTFQEGQSLLGPVQMAFILPAMTGVIPGVELTPALACVPVVNTVFAFRALLQDRAMPLEYAITAVATLAFAALAVWIALRSLSREPRTRRARDDAAEHGPA